jgi:nitrite reductase/ring-hydroxylating ferredoxin subunit
MKSVIGLFFTLLFLCSCGKENSYVPDYPVNFSKPLTDPSLLRLSSPNGAVSFDNYGVAGILIYRRVDNAYVAYDRCSTVNPEQKNAVNLDESSITATDPVSGAKYFLNDGSPAKAPAKTALKRYNVTIAGNTLYVRN